MKKKNIIFKPFDSLEWHDATEEQAKEVLTEDQFKYLKKNKNYNVGTGTFKID